MIGQRPVPGRRAHGHPERLRHDVAALLRVIDPARGRGGDGAAGGDVLLRVGCAKAAVAMSFLGWSMPPVSFRAR